MNKTSVLGTIEILIDRCHLAVLLIEFRQQDREVIQDFLGELTRMICYLMEYLDTCGCRDPIPALIADIRSNRKKIALASQDDYPEMLFRLLDNIRPALREIKSLVEETG